MTRLALIALVGFGACACAIDGPEPGSTSVQAEMERQDRIREQQAQRQRLCQMLDRERDSERYERDCAHDGGHH